MNLKRNKKHLLRFLINIGTSGKYKGTTNFGLSDYLIRYWLMNFVIVFGSVILAVFFVDNFRSGRFFTAINCISMIVMAVITFILARTKIEQFIPALLLMVSYGLLCVMITSTGESEGANFLFIYVYPLLTIMLLGRRFGITLSLILIAAVSLEMFNTRISHFNYPLALSMRMLTSYLLVFAITLVIDTTRKAKDRLIEIQHKKLTELNKRLFSANEKLAALSTTDELTKLNNRRAFLNYMEILWKQSQRLNLPITMLIIDIDFFKNYNDTLGHLEGDRALIAIAQCMKNRLKRETDFIARFGGEEFICLLPYIEQVEAVDFANELVRSVENMKIPHPASENSKYITISAGIASIVPDDNNTWEQLLYEADKALYKAKSSGRNRLAAESAGVSPLLTLF